MKCTSGEVVSDRSVKVESDRVNKSHKTTSTTNSSFYYYVETGREREKVEKIAKNNLTKRKPCDVD